MTSSFLGVTAHFFTPDSNKRHSICIALRKFPSPHTGVKIAELLQRIVAVWEIPCNTLFRVFTDNGSDIVAAFKENNEDDIAESDGDESDTNSVTLEESEEIFPDQDGENGRGVSSEEDNFDICEKDHQDAFVGWKRSGCFVHTLQLVVKVFETAPA